MDWRLYPFFTFSSYIYIYMFWLSIKNDLYFNSIPGLIALGNEKSIFVEEYLIGKLNNGMIFYVQSTFIALIPLTRIASLGKAILMGILHQILCKTFYSSHFHYTSIWKAVWSKLAPPNVEVFYWQVINDKVAIKAELVKRGLLEASSVNVHFVAIKLKRFIIFFSVSSSFGKFGRSAAIFKESIGLLSGMPLHSSSSGNSLCLRHILTYGEWLFGCNPITVASKMI